jgi:hypothetical protein
MLAVGNDDVFGGAAYSVGGPTIISDDWVWSVVPEPSTGLLLGFGLVGLAGSRWRKRGS